MRFYCAYYPSGVLLPEPGGLAERQTTHSSTSEPDECKRAVHKGARDSPSLECRGGHTTEHPDCVVWVAAETHRRPRPREVFFSLSRVSRASARQSPCQTPEVGRQRVTGGSGVTLSLGEGRQREASRRATQCDLTVHPVTKKEVRHTHHKRACSCA